MSRVGIGMMKDSLTTRAIYKLLEICPWFIKICWCVLMFSDVAGVSNVGVPLVEKIAYIGQAAELVSNIDSHYEDPALYYENETYITSWKGNTAEPSDCHYVGKFHMDDKRNIWILRVESEDAGTYSVKFGAKLKRHVVNITLTVKGNLTGEKIEEVRKWLNDHLENIKGSLDRWYLPFLGLLIFICIIGMLMLIGIIILLCIPANRKFTGEQIMQIRELLDEHKKHTKEYVEETISKVLRQSKKDKIELPRNDETFHSDMQPSASSDVHNSDRISGKLEGLDLDSNDEKDLLMNDHVDQIESEDDFHAIVQEKKIHIRKDVK